MLTCWYGTDERDGSYIQMGLVIGLVPCHMRDPAKTAT